jgi:hypothetical protein
MQHPALLLPFVAQDLHLSAETSDNAWLMSGRPNGWVEFRAATRIAGKTTTE